MNLLFDAVVPDDLANQRMSVGHVTLFPAAADTVDVAAERCVVRHGNPFAELTSVADLVETVFLSESGCGCLSQQFLQLVAVLPQGATGSGRFP